MIKPINIIVNQKCCFNQNSDIYFVKQVFPQVKINNVYFTSFGLRNRGAYPEPYVVLENNTQIPLRKYVKELQNNLEVLEKDDERVVYNTEDKIIVKEIEKPT